MGFVPSETECDVWMHDCGDHYEHITACVDDLLIVSKNPSKSI